MQKIAFLALISLIACNGDKDTGTSTEDNDGDLYSPSSGDCDDNDAQVNPGMTEVYCDGLDNDCVDGDDDDHDGDGHLCDDLGDDCDDEDAYTYPTAADPCGDNIDNDCGGELECDCDDDTFDGEQCDGSDCDDTDAAVNKDATDSCYDGVDADCSGNDDYDCDGDGYASADYGGDDCADADTSVNPGITEVCNDTIDNDCSVDTPDCDCDGDGEGGVECGGTDCDDSDPAVGPLGDETEADGIDNDCDGATDEEAYCNIYFPTTNGSGPKRVYSTLFYDGTTYTEEMHITDWESSTGEAEIYRALTSSISTWEFYEYYTCAAGKVEMTGFSATSGGIPLAAGTYSTTRPILLPEAELIEGASWTYAYEATDATLGKLWDASGTMVVLAPETIETTSGTYTDALVIENTYSLADNYDGSLSRDGVVTYYFAPYIGLVYSEDISVTPRGTTDINETRELVSYDGFYP